ncbi:MAG: thermonuclease family protein [Rhodocyclaceae bacterium]|nr:thermonuclease family protein [Rhodocyclaceae bacterium]
MHVSIVNTPFAQHKPQANAATLLCTILVAGLATIGLNDACAKGNANAKSAGARLAGEVISVADGDTLTVFNREARTTYKIRLAYIDAPEKAQPFGARAKQALSAICFGKPAKVLVVDTDHYGRSVGQVSCDGIAANQKMVADGMAWVYRKYAPRDSDLLALEQNARADKRGLWVDGNAIPPWEFRRINGGGN